MKLKTILFVLLFQCVNLYSQSDIKFIEDFTKDIIIDKKTEKYKNYIYYLNGFNDDNLSEQYQKQIEFMVEYSTYEKDISGGMKHIKILNITGNDSLINEIFNINKNLNHNYYLIYNKNEMMTFVITNQKGRIVSYFGLLNKSQDPRIMPWYLYDDLVSEFQDEQEK